MATATAAVSCGTPIADAPTAGVVSRVVDGDTLRVERDGHEERVRLLGIDTPEVAHEAGGDDECGGENATAATRRLAPAGTSVRLTPDATQDPEDRYGRTLAYVSVSGRDIAAQLLAQGWARPYVFAGRPVRRAGRYDRLSRSARARGRGIWGRCGQR